MNIKDISSHVHDPARLAALHAVALLDTPTEESFDRLSWLASRFLHAPVALVSLVDANRQFFKSSIGLPEPWKSRRETPLTHSFCQHNRTAGKPLIIVDARLHPIVKDNLAIRDLGVIAYLGIPLVTDDGYILGSFCVVDTKVRHWTDEDIEIIQNLALAVMTEIQLRTEIVARKQAEGERDTLAELNAQLQAEMSARMKAEERQRQLEFKLNQVHRMEAIGRLAGGVAHDFNNMLGVILGHTEMAISMLDSSEPVLSDLRQIRTAAERSAETTRQLLAFARKQNVVPKILDLNSTINGMITVLRRLIGEHIDLAWQPGVDLWLVRIDPTQVDHILVNLCVNGRDAIAGVGSIHIETGNLLLNEEQVQAHAGILPGEYVRISIRDSGIGMDRETLNHVFEPFFTTKDSGEGNGLGLATVYGAVKQNQGFIQTKSKPNEGTTFTIFLPRYTGSIAPARKEDSLPLSQYERKTLLVVEDDASVLRMITLMLERLDYVVLAVASAEEAIRMIEEDEKENIILLITDIIMPGMSGPELVQRVTALRPKLRNLYISGYTADYIAQHGEMKPATHFIQKPFTKDGLAAAVRSALESS
jgi:signal transduction histidine kinase/ActR/RegA family two-component response regulator